MCKSKLSRTCWLREGYWKFTFSNLISPDFMSYNFALVESLTSRVDFSSIKEKIFLPEAFALETEGMLAMETPAPIAAEIRMLIDI